MRDVPRALLAAALLTIAACGRSEPPAAQAPASAAPAPAKQASEPASASKKLELVPAEPVDQDAAEVVAREAARAKADGRELLVYVGAPWCEPCPRFHEAALAGELDSVLPRLRFVEFDHDRDLERLERAGYTSKLIPLFAVPEADGRASALRIEGSIKGEGAVDQILPRLAALLVKARQRP